MIHENSLAASQPFPFDEIDERENPDTRHNRQERNTHSDADLFEFARWLVSYIRGKDRCRVTVDCLTLALGDAELEKITMTTVALKRGLTKAAISKRVKEIRKDLKLPINANNKSQHASSRYAETNRSPLRLRP